MLKKIYILGWVILLGVFTLAGCSNKLNGKYKADLSFLDSNQSIVIEFEDKDEVSLNVEDEGSIKGTYELRDGKVIMQFVKYEVKGKLSDDKKSFRLMSDEGMFNDSLSGVKFIKE